ncbi:MAG: GntR family transcriptional regulator [Abditibacteriota bacterium]|nr:GntR family transcriptional regulator [Abditibacteriota bacterium]
MTKKELVKQHLYNLIRTLNEGDKIPSEASIMKELNVSRFTVRSAIGDLLNENVIFTQNGVGSFVQYREHKKIVLVLLEDNLLVGRLRKTYKVLYNMIIEKLELKGYNPIYYSDKDDKVMDFVKKNQKNILGVIAVHCNEDLLKEINSYGIPIVYTHKSTCTVYPTIIVDYNDFFKKLNMLIHKYKFKDILFFSFKYVLNKKDSKEGFFMYTINNYFSKYNLNYIPFSLNVASALSIFRSAMNKLKKAPDAIIFLDDNIFNTCVPLFKEFENIISNTKIITQSNGFIESEYDLCCIEFNLEESVEKTIGLLENINKNNYCGECNLYIKPSVINEEILIK